MGSVSSSGFKKSPSVPDLVGEVKVDDFDTVLSAKQGVEARAGSVLVSDQYMGEVHIVCNIHGMKKDQDRFVIIPKLIDQPRIVFTGVFDGHGRDGDIVAESIASRLPKYIHSCLRERAKDLSSIDPVSDREKQAKINEVVLDTPTQQQKEQDQENSTSEAVVQVKTLQHGLITKVVEEACAAVQLELDEQFERDIVIPTKALKEQIEKAQNVPLGELSLPLGSGTTMTSILLYNGTLYTSYLGDSRAVLCRKSYETGELTSEDLSRDQNVANAGEDDIAAIEKAGGSVCGRHLAGDFIDGMLQLTHSLGDIPLHRKKLVSHIPSIKMTDITKDILFAIIASDGLWDNFSSQEAVQFVHENIQSEIAKNDSPQSNEAMQKILLSTCEKIEAESVNRAAGNGRVSDDTTVLVVCFSHWLQKKTEEIEKK